MLSGSCVRAAAEQQVKLQQEFTKWWSEHPSASVEEVRASPHLLWTPSWGFLGCAPVLAHMLSCCRLRG